MRALLLAKHSKIAAYAHPQWDLLVDQTSSRGLLIIEIASSDVDNTALGVDSCRKRPREPAEKTKEPYDSRCPNPKRRKDGDDTERPPSNTPGCGSDSSNLKFFACPYYKLDPVKHFTCFRRFNLKRVKDVKQHLHRKHAISELYCPTCWCTFERPSMRDQHIIDRLCTPRNPSPKDDLPMTLEQQKAIASRKSSGYSDSEQWFNIWRILFPVRREPESPYLGTEVQEIITTVRQLWKQNSSHIISSIMATNQLSNITGGSSWASHFGSIASASRSTERFSAEILTDGVDTILQKLEELAPALCDENVLNFPSCTSVEAGREVADTLAISRENEDSSTPYKWSIQQQSETEFSELQGVDLQLNWEEDWLPLE